MGRKLSLFLFGIIFFLLGVITILISYGIFDTFLAYLFGLKDYQISIWRLTHFDISIIPIGVFFLAIWLFCWMEISFVPMLYEKKKEWILTVVYFAVIILSLILISNDIMHTSSTAYYPITPEKYYSLNRWLERIPILFLGSAFIALIIEQFRGTIIRVSRYSTTRKFMLFVPIILVQFVRGFDLCFYMILELFAIFAFAGIGIPSLIFHLIEKSEGKSNEKRIISETYAQDKIDKYEIDELFDSNKLRKLARKYADGEIPKEEYERLKKILEE